MKLASTWILALVISGAAQAQLLILPDAKPQAVFGGGVRVNGDVCDVLVDAAGNVIVVGEQVIWSNESPATKTGRYQIQAKTMGTSP